jgi:DNA-binding LacI/PurR family transcriptional regulator
MNSAKFPLIKGSKNVGFHPLRAIFRVASADSANKGHRDTESGFRAATQLLERAPRKFTAIVAANDHMALGALRALHAKGIRVPEQCSVVGYDDLPESRFFEPPLTTVRHDFAGQGARCVEVLSSMIKGQPFEPALQLLRPELVIRESTATARR